MAITIDGSTGWTYSDNIKHKYGTGEDLEIFHESDQNYLTSSNGRINLRASEGRFENAAGNEVLAKFIDGGACELRYNDSAKLVTTNTGISVTGGMLVDGGQAITGSAYDYLYGHNAATSAQSGFTIRGNEATVEILATDAGDHSGSLVIRGNNDGYGIINSANGNRLEIVSFTASGDEFNIHGGANTSRLEKCIVANQDAGVELYYNNSKKIEASNGGIIVAGSVEASGNLSLADDGKAKFGGEDDLQIYHNGTDSYIDNKTNDLVITTTGDGDDINIVSKDDVWIGVNGTEDGIKVIGDGAVELYYDNNKKLHTYSEGVKVTGYIKAGNNIADSHWGDNTNNWHGIHNDQSGTNTCIFENSADSQPYGIDIYFSDTAPDDNHRYFIWAGDGTSARFRVYSSGDTWNHDDSYTGSDQTLKENIVDATPKLEDLKKLKVRNFNWKSEYFPERSKRKHLGFIAQEVEEVFPALVTEHDIGRGNADSDHTPIMKKAIKQAWSPIIIKAMQELIEKVETLETKVAALEAG